jgi:CheY-like chemotaxis protein
MRPNEAVILLVDDEENVCQSLHRNLLPLGAKVVTRVSGNEAIKWLRENRADVIVADYQMPIMDGIDFLRQAKSLRPEARRMMLTGNADLAVALTALEGDLIERYITKPWEADKLCATMTQIIRDMEK